MMRPISRIPMEIDSPPLHSIVHGELKNLGDGNAAVNSAMWELLSHAQNNEQIEFCLDWAMQIRTEMGIDWGSAIEAAMVLYFG